MNPEQKATEEGGEKGLREHTWGVCCVHVLFVACVSVQCVCVLWCVFSRWCVCVPERAMPQTLNRGSRPGSRWEVGQRGPGISGSQLREHEGRQELARNPRQITSASSLQR